MMAWKMFVHALYLYVIKVLVIARLMLLSPGSRCYRQAHVVHRTGFSQTYCFRMHRQARDGY